MKPRTFNAGANAAVDSIRAYLRRLLAQGPQVAIPTVLTFLSKAKLRYNKKPGGRGNFGCLLAHQMHPSKTRKRRSVFKI